MATQTNPVTLGQGIQTKLAAVLTPVPVYAAFNRNFATQPKFATWQLRNVHQPVYTGQTQSNKGIDTPIFQVNIYAQSMEDAFTLSNTLLQSLHGFTGLYVTIWVAKTDVEWLYNTYDNELGLNQIILDCTLDIPA